MSPVAAVVVRLVAGAVLAAPSLALPVVPVELAATLVDPWTPLVPREVAELGLLETGVSFPPVTGPRSPSLLEGSEPQAPKPSTEPAQSSATSPQFCRVATAHAEALS